MNTNQHQDDFSEVQAAIFRVALSLDSFLLNGIPYGVIHQDVFTGFLEMTAGNLVTALASLEQHAPHAPVTSESRVREALAALRAKCQQLIDLVTELSSFRTLPLQQLRATISQIPVLRGECVQRIEQVEACFRTPQPFYQTRPSHSTASVTDFLANLEQIFEDELAPTKVAAG